MSTDKAAGGPVALVLGLCAHGLAVVRSLHRAGIKVYAFERRPDVPGAATRLAEVLLIDSYEPDYLVARLRAFATEQAFTQPPRLFLTNDDMVRTIARRWPELQDRYELSWASSRDSVLRLLDKRNLEQAVRDKGLDYPTSWIVGGEHGVEQLRDASYPILIKPSKPLSSFKAEKVFNAQAAIDLVTEHAASAPFIAQTWIPGNDEQLVFCALYYKAGQVLASFEGRKIRSLPRARGQTTVAEPVENAEIRRLTRQFFDGYIDDGPVSMEFKRDDLNNYWVIEPTIGRTDYWADVCIENGVNFPLIEYHGACTDDCRMREARVWYDAERDPFAYLELVVRQKTLRPYGKRPVFTYLHRDDWRPFGRAMQTFLRRVLRFVRTRIGSERNRLQGEARGTGREYSLSVTSMQATLPATRQLFARAADNELFDGSEWYELLARVSGYNSRVYCANEQADCRAILVMREANTRLGLTLSRNLLSLSNYYTARYRPILARADTAAEDLAALIEAMAGEAPAWDVIDIAPLDRTDGNYEIIRATLARCGFRVLEYFRYGNWYRRFHGESYAEFFASLPGSVRSTIRRKKKRLQAAGAYRSVIYRGPDGLAQGRADYWAVYANSWKATEPMPGVVNGLMDLAAAGDMLRLGVGYLDGVPISTQFWITQHRHTSIYKLAYDERYKQHSPGTVLEDEMFQHAIDTDRVEFVDYLTGDDSYKAMWMTDRKEKWGIRALNQATLVGKAMALRENVKNMLSSA